MSASPQLGIFFDIPPKADLFPGEQRDGSFGIWYCSSCGQRGCLVGTVGRNLFGVEQ